MKYNKIKIARISGRANYYLPALNRYLLKDWVDNVWIFYRGLGMVKKGKKWNYVRPDGTYLMKDWVDDAFNFGNEDFGAIKKGRKWNYIKRDGTFLLDEWVDYAYVFNDGISVVRKNKNRYRVDKEGNLYEI